MEKRTESEIIHDMEGIIFTRARKMELLLKEFNDDKSYYIWNEYKILLNRLDLWDEYEMTYWR